MTALARQDSIEIVTTRVRHAALLSAYYQRNAQRFLPWQPAVRADHHSIPSWTLRLKEREQGYALGQSVHFILLSGDQLVATCSLTDIEYGQNKSCVVGYSVDGDFEGQGYMSRLLRYVIHYAFTNLQLNSIRASYMPGNVRSAGLLEKLGFEHAGYAEKFLYINNCWEDHVLVHLAQVRRTGLSLIEHHCKLPDSFY